MLYTVHASAAPVYAREPVAYRGLTKADAAYAEIRARILSCDLPPGSVIEQEPLANWLGASTTPVREALRRLAAEQFVTLPAHSDARVAPVSVEEFEELHTVRLGLEPLAAGLAAEHADEGEIAAIRALLDAELPSDQPIEADDRSRSLHRAIYVASGNRTLTQILDSTWDRISRYRVILARAGLAATCHSLEHEAIVDALAARDAPSASRRVREHLEATFRVILPAAGEAIAAYR